MTISHFRGLKVDEGRAREVLAQLYADYVAGRKIYGHINRQEAPQIKFRPEGVTVGDEHHVRWLFFATLTDRRDLSENVYATHNKLWHQERRFYEASVLELKWSDRKQALKRYQVSMPTTATDNWLVNARTLHTLLGRNPLAIFSHASIEDVVRFKENHPLPGYGTKLLSLLALFYQEAGAIKDLPENTFPIDLHVQRLAIATGIINGKITVTNARLESILRPLFYRIAIEQGFEILELAHALWFLGNRLCTGCSLSSVPRHYCPVYEECGGALPTRPYFKKGRWELGSQVYRRGGDNIFGLPAGAPLFSRVVE